MPRTDAKCLTDQLYLYVAVIEMVVYLRDRTGVMFTLEDGHLARAEELLEMVCEEQGLPAEAQRVFALWLVSTLIGKSLCPLACVYSHW